jgi:hypothetical protein
MKTPMPVNDNVQNANAKTGDALADRTVSAITTTPTSAELLQLFEVGKLAPSWLVAGDLNDAWRFTSNLALALLASPKNGHGMLMEKIARHIQNECYGNLLVLKKAEEDTDMSVESVKPLHAFLQRRPLVQGARVVIIDSLDQMNRFGVNSILKALEEPPADTYIFVLTPHLVDVLPTIRSRCQVLHVGKGEADTGHDAALMRAASDLLDKVLQGDFRHVQALCEATVGGDKARYEGLAQAVFAVLHARVVQSVERGLLVSVPEGGQPTKDLKSDTASTMADLWLLGCSFWQDAKETHLDLSHAFMTLLVGLSDPELLRSR